MSLIRVQNSCVEIKTCCVCGKDVQRSEKRSVLTCGHRHIGCRQVIAASGGGGGGGVGVVVDAAQCQIGDLVLVRGPQWFHVLSQDSLPALFPRFQQLERRVVVTLQSTTSTSPSTITSSCTGAATTTATTSTPTRHLMHPVRVNFAQGRSGDLDRDRKNFPRAFPDVTSMHITLTRSTSRRCIACTSNVVLLRCHQCFCRCLRCCLRWGWN